jgi:hypothetical protein
MKTENLIAIDVFCNNHNIEVSFISSLYENGLIELLTINEAKFIDFKQLKQIEKIIRFYYELDINLEGIETISHLLERINAMHDEIILLNNRLKLYETNE